MYGEDKNYLLTIIHSRMWVRPETPFVKKTSCLVQVDRPPLGNRCLGISGMNTGEECRSRFSMECQKQKNKILCHLTFVTHIQLKLYVKDKFCTLLNFDYTLLDVN